MILVAFLLRVVVATVFLRSGAVKALNLADFRRAVHNYQLLPSSMIGAVARGLPAAELLVGVLLLLGIELRVVGIAVALMLVVFCVAIAINLLRGRTISCGCSGSVASDISWGHVIGNCVLAIAAVVVAAWPAEPVSALPGVQDAHGSAVWTSRAIAWLLVMSSGAVGALLAVEARRVLAALRAITSTAEDGVR
ncbi:MAG: MauE/DoxX family redox-associated membrane protein [Solirubrobacteraceae bacterium]